MQNNITIINYNSVFLQHISIEHKTLGLWATGFIARRHGCEHWKSRNPSELAVAAGRF